MKSLVKHQRALFMLVCMLVATTAFNNKANAQCTSNSQDGSQTSANTGADLSWTMTAGDYEKITGVSNGATYTVSSSNHSDYITVRTSPGGGSVLTNGTTPETFTATSSTVYVLVNRNSSCGTNNSNRTLTWNAAPYISSAPNSGCIGSSVALVGTGFTGATEVTFHGVDADFTVNSSTSITATVPDGATTGLITVYGPGGSDVTNTFTISGSPSDNSGGNQSSCGGAVTLGASSTWGHTYSWSPSAGLSNPAAANPTVTPSSTTTYTLTERINSTGCSASYTTVVTVTGGPGDNTGGDKSVCSGSGVTIGASSTWRHTYSWSPSSGLSDDGVANPTATPASTTTYTLTETVTNTGCVATNSIVVTVSPLPGNNSGSDKSTCSGVGVTLGASSTYGHTYKWAPSTSLSNIAVSNPTASPSSNITYTLTETITSTGCSVSNSTAVSINATPATPDAISGSATACKNSSGNSYSVPAVAGATSYTWTVPSGWNMSGGSTTNAMTVTAGSASGTITVKANNACGSSSTASLPVSITSTSVTTPTVTGSSPVCAGSTQVYTATSANSSTFTWTVPGGLTLVSGQGTSSITVTAVSGNGLNLTVVGSNACGNNSSNGVKTVTVNAAPSATTGSAASVCAGSSTALGTTTISGHTYSWSPSSGLSNAAISNPTAMPSSTTTYTLTETITSGGCNAANSVVVTVNPLPTDNSGSNKATCSGTAVTLGASGIGGHTYKWSPATGLSGSTVANPTATITASATYTLTETITATGCSASNATVVTVSKKSTAPTSATASVTGYCGTGSTVLTLNGGGGGDNETIAWYSGSCNSGTAVGTGNNLTVSPTSTTTYYGRYEDASPCSYNTTCASVTITVGTAPTDNAGSDKAFCAGGSTTLGASTTSGRTYSWSPSTGLSNAAVSNPTATPASTTTYTLTETITATGCAASNSVVVTVNPIPTATIVPSYCNGGGNVLLTVSLNAAYKWSNGGSDQSITVDRAGTYAVTVTNAGGCTATTDNTVAIELVANGDFEAGNTGFTTTYTYTSASGGLYPEGDYAVGTNANYYHSNFYGTDHTGGGKFMIVNGATSATPVVVWQESVTLVPNTNYYFSAYSTSMNQVSPYAQLKFAVNGVQVGTTAILPQGANSNSGPFAWTRFYATWNSGTNTNVTLSIVDLQTAAGGNDFGLDDISCSTLSTVPLSIDPATNTPCLGGTLNVNSNILGGMSPMTYTWSGPHSFGSTKENDSIINVTALAAGVYNLTVTDAHGCVVTGSSDAAVINTPPSNNAGTAQSTCIGSGIAIGAASVSGHTYKWSPSTGLNSSTYANPTATPASTTTYTLTETITASGCSATNNAVVTVNALPGNNAGSAKTICNNGSTTIGATAITGHTYSWSPVVGLTSAIVANPTAAPTVTTTYTLTETITATGCTASNTVTVTVNAAPTNNAGTAKSVCAGTGIAIGAASVAGHTYSWSPATGLSSAVAANPTATPATTTTYNLTETITASGCGATNSVVVTVNPVLGNNAGANQSVCGGVGVAIGAASVAGHTYKWAPATGLSSSTAANPTATPASTTTYTLAEAITATGCSASNTVVVTLNAAVANNAGTAKTICNGASATIGATSVAGHTYNWSPSTGLSNAAIANPTASPAATTTYTLTEAITATGCTAANTAVVTVNPIPADNAGADQSICSGSGIAIGAVAVAGHTYSWTPTTRLTSGVAANPTATPTVTTTYTLTESITATGCTTSNGIVVTVSPSLSNNAGSAQSTCRGTSVTLGAASVAGHTYTWSPSATLSSAIAANPTATPTVTTTYTLAEAITASGCSASNTVVVTVNTAPAITAQPSNQTTCGATTTFSITATGASYYQWYENRATGSFTAITNAVNSFGEYKNSGSNTLEIDNPTATMDGWSYYCVATSSNACTTTSTTATLTVTNAGMWNGSSSINWTDAANWCGGVPTQTTDVTIPSGVPHQPTINTSDAQCHNLTINSGATVTIVSAGQLSLYGDLVVNGTYKHSAGTIDIKGSGTQNIPAITAYNVVIDNGNNGITLTGDMTVTHALTFNNGILNTGSYEVNVTNTSASAVANFDKSKYVNGFLRRSVGITGIYNFPVGSATQCELATLNLVALIGVSDIVANFNVADMGIPAASLSSNGKPINKFLNYGYWTITPNQQPTLGVYSVTLNPLGQSNGNGADNYVVVKRPHGSGSTSWSMPGTSLLNVVPTILGAVGASMSGLTSFSDFGAGAAGGTVLPIKLISFTGEKTDNDVNALLRWSTATEENNDHFDIEVASATDDNNGELTFRKIGEVKGAGNSVNELDYDFTDDEANKSGTRYYRLKQVDFDGSSTYSNIIALDFNLVKVELSTLYPNPVTDILHFNLTSQDERTVTVSVNNLVGQEIFRKVETLTSGINAMTLDVTQMHKGIFLLSVTDGAAKYQPQKFEKL